MRWNVRATVLALLAIGWGATATLAAIRPGFIEFKSVPGRFSVAGADGIAPIAVSPEDFPGVRRAANDLATDIGRVTGTPAAVSGVANASTAPPILIGTIGRSGIIDKLIRDGRLDVDAVRGKWESYVLQIVDNPMPGVKQAFVIAGSDKRGTIYGIYDLCENIGVSPWHWWADVPVRKQTAVTVTARRIVQGPPAVKYRGIFINDEAPAMSGWTRKQFGGFNSKMYTKVFELLLRLRANYLWPAMWGNAFNEDDPENPRLADEYGIVMGTSHQEAMLRAQAEFDRRYKAKDWNYATQPKLMESFWREGVRRNRAYESLITIGMRGRDDTEMLAGATTQQSMALLETIVGRQRQILAEEVNPDVTKVPQVWCLYKEVQGYYEHGLRVPDDVTLLWADDNWGNIRRVPTAAERNRAGGAGVYYHFDYVGSPRNYKWINTNPLPKIQEQMSLAYEYGADRIWIVNVGDLKPMELPIDFFMTMAWNPPAMTKDKVADYTRNWAAQQFGPEHAGEIADIVSRYAKYNGWRKPELLSPATFSLVNYEEAERVEAAWMEIGDAAQRINDRLPPQDRDAFFQLILYPTKASATVAKLYLAAARNALYARQGRASAADQASRVRELFKQDQTLSDVYNTQIAGGKWAHMMDQVRIGYTKWNDPPKNMIPAVVDPVVPGSASLGVAVEGSESVWPDEASAAALPAFDVIGRQSRWIDVFRRGRQSFNFTATADRPWIKISLAKCTVDQDRRLRVTIDWTLVPDGTNDGTITIARDGGEAIRVRVAAVMSSDAVLEASGAFGSLTEAVTIPADAASHNVAVDGVCWETVPDYGRAAAAMSIFPVTAASVLPPKKSACLEYSVYLPNAGDVKIDAILGVAQNIVPGRGVRLAISIDDAPPQVLDVFASPEAAAKGWGKTVSENVRKLTSTHRIEHAGRHTLKVWMVDPGVVLESLVLNSAQQRDSYFGPPAAVPFALPENVRQ